MRGRRGWLKHGYSMQTVSVAGERNRCVCIFHAFCTKGADWLCRAEAVLGPGVTARTCGYPLVAAVVPRTPWKNP